MVCFYIRQTGNVNFQPCKEATMDVKQAISAFIDYQKLNSGKKHGQEL